MKVYCQQPLACLGLLLQQQVSTNQKHTVFNVKRQCLCLIYTSSLSRETVSLYNIHAVSFERDGVTFRRDDVYLEYIRRLFQLFGALACEFSLQGAGLAGTPKKESLSYC